MPQNNHGDAVLPGSEKQSAAGSEIEHGRRPPGFNNHGAKPLAAQPIRPAAQHRIGIGRAQKQHSGWIGPEIVQSIGMDLTQFQRRKVLTHPEKPFGLRKCAQRERQRETGSRSPRTRHGGKHFMHCARQQAAAKAGVGRHMAEGSAGQRQSGYTPRQGFQVRFEGRIHLFVLCLFQHSIEPIKSQTQIKPLICNRYVLNDGQRHCPARRTGDLSAAAAILRKGLFQGRDARCQFLRTLWRCVLHQDDCKAVARFPFELISGDDA